METAQLKACSEDVLKVTQDRLFSITLQCYDANGEPTIFGELIATILYSTFVMVIVYIVIYFYTTLIC